MRIGCLNKSIDASVVSRPRQKGSEHGRLPDGPPKTTPGPSALQPPPSPARVHPKQMRMNHIYQYSCSWSGFGHRNRNRTPISESVKYRVHLWARSPCEGCGAGCCLANPPRVCPGGGSHHPQKPGQLQCHQQHSGALCPLKHRQTGYRSYRLPRYSDQLGAAAVCCWRRSWRSTSPTPISRRHGADGLA